MTTFHTMALLSWANICTTWAGLFVAQMLIKRRRMEILPSPNRQSMPAESVAVIIPARNEADNIESCIDRVLEQDHADLRAVVVDDRSEDDTAAIIQKRCVNDPRVLLRRVLFVRTGWLSKSNALWTGTRDIDATWFLFLDADCTLHPAAVRTALEEANRRKADGLTFWPRNGAIGFWEHMLIPLCAGIIALWFGTRELRKPGRSGFANGQFLLIRREAYERVGGHAAVRNAVIEDIPFAELAARSGLSIPSLAGRHLISVRMYTSLRGVIDGWARIYVGAIRSGTKMTLSVLWLLTGSLLPYIAAPILIAILLQPGLHPFAKVLSWVCASHLLVMMIVSCRFWAMGDCRRRYLLLYPVSVVVVIGILFQAWWMLIVRREVSWRGTRYAINRRGLIVG